MVRTFLIAAALTAAPAALAQTTAVPTVAETTPATDPVALDLARQIINIASPPATRNDQITTMFRTIGTRSMAAVKQRFDFGDPEMQKIFDRHMDRTFNLTTDLIGKHMPAIFDAMAVAYAKRFSVPELRQILAFAQSPTGTKYLQSGFEIAQDPGVVAVQKAMMNDMLGQMPALQAELEKDLKAYQESKDSKGNPKRK